MSCTEVQVNVEGGTVSSVRCGGDGTIFLTAEGALYACGSNKARRSTCLGKAKINVVFIQCYQMLLFISKVGLTLFKKTTTTFLRSVYIRAKYSLSNIFNGNVYRLNVS